jgi:hypothetical protein
MSIVYFASNSSPIKDVVIMFGNWLRGVSKILWAYWSLLHSHIDIGHYVLSMLDNIRGTLRPKRPLRHVSGDVT